MMTKQGLRDEIIACGKDPVYFIKKHVRIKHPQRGLIPFSLFRYQEQLVSDYVSHRFNIVLKARQMGVSEVTAAFAAWLMLFHRDKNIVVMATKVETAKNIIRKVRTAIEKLPPWLMLADIRTDNKLSIELTNGSIIKAITTSPDAGRSEALSLLIIDEAAFVEGLDELWTGLLPTVQAGGRVILLSTPNGVGNKFHQIYSEAETGVNDFHHTRLMWWLHPERISDLEDDPFRPGFKTSTWYKREIRSANMSTREVAQELECAFNGSGDTVVSNDYLERIEQGVLEPQIREHWDRNLFVWWQPQVGKKYFISADVARGDGRDNSAAHVWDCHTMEQQAEYYGKIPPDEFAQLLVELGKKYENALLVVENNTVGLACLEHIKLANYPSVYFSRKGDNKPGESVDTSWGTYTDDLVCGFTTSARTRPLIVSKLEEYVRNQSVIIRSRRMHEELKTFVWKNGRAEASRGYNDDLIMAGAIGCWIRDTFLSTNFASAEVQKGLLSGISVESHVNTGVPGASKDPRFIRHSSQGVYTSAPQDASRIRLPGGQVADFSWLISKG